MEKINYRTIIIIFSISFILTTLLKDITLFKPLFNYITAVHEMCHAFFAIITGGSIEYIDLSNHGGVAGTKGGFFPLISIGGYIGTTLIGIILLLVSVKEKYSNYFLRFFTVIMLILYFIYMKSYFNLYFLATIIISIALFTITFYKHTKYLVIILSSVFIADSFTDAKVYLFSKFMGYGDIMYKTDDGILARYLGFEFLTLPIAILIF